MSERWTNSRKATFKRHTPEQALQLLLAGSGLAYRRTADGAYVIHPAPPLAPSEPDNPVSLPELLVTARSPNSDIPRPQDDIQLYKVWTSRDLAHRASTPWTTSFENACPAPLSPARRSRTPSIRTAAADQRSTCVAWGPARPWC